MIIAAWWLCFGFVLAAGFVFLCGVMTGEWEAAILGGATVGILGVVLRNLGARIDGD